MYTSIELNNGKDKYLDIKKMVAVPIFEKVAVPVLVLFWPVLVQGVDKGRMDRWNRRFPEKRGAVKDCLPSGTPSRRKEGETGISRSGGFS